MSGVCPGAFMEAGSSRTASASGPFDAVCSVCKRPVEDHRAAARRYVLTIPVPPSLNVYYQNARRKIMGGAKAGKTYTAKMISPEGEQFRAQVIGAVRKGHRVPPRLAGRLAIFVYVAKASETAVITGGVQKGTRRARNVRSDLDNLWKCLLDGLTVAEVVGDDSQFDDIRMVRGNQERVGRVVVSIEQADPDAYLKDAQAAGVVLRAVGEEELPF